MSRERKRRNNIPTPAQIVPIGLWLGGGKKRLITLKTHCSYNSYVFRYLVKHRTIFIFMNVQANIELCEFRCPLIYFVILFHDITIYNNLNI